MTILASAALWFLPFAAPICLWVAFNDMKFMKIPNLAVMALLIVYLVIGLIALPFSDYAWQLIHVPVVLVIGFVANMLRLMGAGDAKFLTAMSPFVPLADAQIMVFLFAATLLAAFTTHRIARALPFIRRMTPEWQSWQRGDFPMGLALGGVMILYLVLGSLYGSA